MSEKFKASPRSTKSLERDIHHLARAVDENPHDELAHRQFHDALEENSHRFHRIASFDKDNPGGDDGFWKNSIAASLVRPEAHQMRIGDHISEMDASGNLIHSGPTGDAIHVITDVLHRKDQLPVIMAAPLMARNQPARVMNHPVRHVAQTILDREDQGILPKTKDLQPPTSTSAPPGSPAATPHPVEATPPASPPDAATMSVPGASKGMSRMKSLEDGKPAQHIYNPDHMTSVVHPDLDEFYAREGPMNFSLNEKDTYSTIPEKYHQSLKSASDMFFSGRQPTEHVADTDLDGTSLHRIGFRMYKPVHASVLRDHFLDHGHENVSVHSFPALNAVDIRFVDKPQTKSLPRIKPSPFRARLKYLQAPAPQIQVKAIDPDLHREASQAAHRAYDLAEGDDLDSLLAGQSAASNVAHGKWSEGKTTRETARSVFIDVNAELRKRKKSLPRRVKSAQPRQPKYKPGDKLLAIQSSEHNLPGTGEHRKVTVSHTPHDSQTHVGEGGYYNVEIPNGSEMLVSEEHLHGRFSKELEHAADAVIHGERDAHGPFMDAVKEHLHPSVSDRIEIYHNSDPSAIENLADSIYRVATFRDNPPQIEKGHTVNSHHGTGIVRDVRKDRKDSWGLPDRLLVAYHDEDGAEIATHEHYPDEVTPVPKQKSLPRRVKSIHQDVNNLLRTVKDGLHEHGDHSSHYALADALQDSDHELASYVIGGGHEDIPRRAKKAAHYALQTTPKKGDSVLWATESGLFNSARVSTDGRTKDGRMILDQDGDYYNVPPEHVHTYLHPALEDAIQDYTHNEDSDNVLQAGKDAGYSHMEKLGRHEEPLLGHTINYHARQIDKHIRDRDAIAETKSLYGQKSHDASSSVGQRLAKQEMGKDHKVTYDGKYGINTQFSVDHPETNKKIFFGLQVDRIPHEGGLHHEVSFERDDDDDGKHSHAITNDMPFAAPLVMREVIAGLNEAIKKDQPDTVGLTVNPNEKDRHELYAKILPSYAEAHGYEHSHQLMSEDGRSLYRHLLTKKPSVKSLYGQKGIDTARLARRLANAKPSPGHEIIHDDDHTVRSRFPAGEHHYSTHALRTDNTIGHGGAWTFSFQREAKDGGLGTHEWDDKNPAFAPLVLEQAAHAVGRLAKDKGANEIHFMTSDEEPDREKLYGAYLPLMADGLGFHLEKYTTPGIFGGNNYVMRRKEPLPTTTRESLLPLPVTPAEPPKKNLESGDRVFVKSFPTGKFKHGGVIGGRDHAGRYEVIPPNGEVSEFFDGWDLIHRKSLEDGKTAPHTYNPTKISRTDHPDVRGFYVDEHHIQDPDEQEYTLPDKYTEAVTKASGDFFNGRPHTIAAIRHNDAGDKLYVLHFPMDSPVHANVLHDHFTDHGHDVRVSSFPANESRGGVASVHLLDKATHQKSLPDQNQKAVHRNVVDEALVHGMRSSEESRRIFRDHPDRDNHIQRRAAASAGVMAASTVPERGDYGTHGREIKRPFTDEDYQEHTNRHQDFMDTNDAVRNITNHGEVKQHFHPDVVLMADAVHSGDKDARGPFKDLLEEHHPHIHEYVHEPINTYHEHIQDPANGFVDEHGQIKQNRQARHTRNLQRAESISRRRLRDAARILSGNNITSSGVEVVE